MALDMLKEKILLAQKSLGKRKPTGNRQIVIDYIYAEILYSIDNQKFYMPKRSREAQAKLFTIGINGKDIFLYTHWVYNAKHVKCFKCVSEDEAKNIVQAIRSAVEQVGLNFVPIKFGNEKAYISIDIEKSMT